MKPEDLRSVYDVTDDFHNSVLCSLYRLDDKAIKDYKKRSAVIKAALICAIAALLGTITTVAAATDFFGLLSSPVGNYGLNINIEDKETPSEADKKHVKLKLGYIPEGYENTSINPKYAHYVSKTESDNWTFTIDIKYADTYDVTEKYVVESYETEYNGHQTIIATYKYMENKDEYGYSATEYFEDWGYVVVCKCPNLDEMLKIMEQLELEEDTEHYTKPAPKKREDKERGEYIAWYNEEYFLKDIGIGESFDCEAKNGDNVYGLTLKIKSVEERFNSDGLDREDFFNEPGIFNVQDRYFDADGNLLTPYTRIEIHGGDGINSLGEELEVVDDRHFYLVTFEVTSNDADIDYLTEIFYPGVSKMKEYEDGSIGWAESVYGRAETIYDSYLDESYVLKEPLSIKKGETKTLTYGIVVDGDALDVTYLAFYTAVYHNSNVYCVKLDQ